jgi:hypothetical protein
MTQDLRQPNRMLIEFDLAAPTDAIAKRAQTACDAGQNADHTTAIALAGTDDALLNVEDSQVWRETIAPFVEASQATIVAWRATSLGGGDLVATGAEACAAACARLVAVIKAAGDRGLSALTIPVARIGDDPYLGYGDALNRTFELIAQSVPHLERSGVTLCLPAAHGGFLMSPPEMRELLDRLDSSWVAADIDVAQPRCDRATIGDWLQTLDYRVGVVGTRAKPSPDSNIEIPQNVLQIIRTH